VRIEGRRSTMVVSYDAATPAEARRPFEDGVRLWADVLPSAVEIRIWVAWQEINGGTLAAASTPFFVPGSSKGADKLDDDTIYGPVLAAALQGNDFIGADEVHVSMVFNKRAAWHYGAGDAPFDKWDLATTSLHELTHGMFFAGVVDVDPARGVGFFSSGSMRPSRFDRFLTASSGAGLATMCNGNGTYFYNAVTNGGLSFTDAAHAGTSFALFSPTTFQPGSSTYHHDPSRLAADCKSAGIAHADCSDLMTQKLPNGYTQRALGEPVLRMLAAVLSDSAGVKGAAGCDVSAGVAGRDGSEGGAAFGERFDLPPWAIATVTGIAAIGVLAVVVALASSVLARRRGDDDDDDEREGEEQGDGAA
jgi:hypothetical protein